MADENRKDENGKDLEDSRLKASPREDNNEWLQGQMGEDHNLSGASTYRTLPDQPDKSADESESGDQGGQKS